MQAYTSRMKTVNIGVKIRLTKNPPTPPANASSVSPGPAKSGAKIRPRMPLSCAEIRAKSPRRLLDLRCRPVVLCCGRRQPVGYDRHNSFRETAHGDG